MKKRFWFVCTVFMLAAFLGGCADDPSTSNHQSAAVSHDQPDPSEIPPHDGMTKDQVAARYGRPRVVYMSDRGEVWRYLLNGGEIASKALIPFYLPVRPRFGIVIFGTDGRVKEFHWQPDPEN